MKASTLYRIAAVLLLLFAVGHTLGFRQSDPSWGIDALLSSLRSIHFNVQGFSRTTGTSLSAPDSPPACSISSLQSWPGSLVVSPRAAVKAFVVGSYGQDVSAPRRSLPDTQPLSEVTLCT